MNERANPFAQLNETVKFSTKQRQHKPVAEAAIEEISQQNNFPSRQAPKAQTPSRRKPRTYRTGRNVQFNAKVTRETDERFYKAVEDRDVVLGELLKQALDALEAIDPLKKIADRRGISLTAVVSEAVDALERAGVSRDGEGKPR
jgi:hypothetical protein